MEGKILLGEAGEIEGVGEAWTAVISRREGELLEPPVMGVALEKCISERKGEQSMEGMVLER